MYRLRSELEPWILQALNEYPDDNVGWEMSLNLYPDPSTDNEFVPTLALYFQIKGASEGTCIYSSALITPFGNTPKSIHKLVVETVDHMLHKREVQESEILKSLGNNSESLGL